jgi:hypothetical protein
MSRRLLNLLTALSLLLFVAADGSWVVSYRAPHSVRLRRYYPACQQSVPRRRPDPSDAVAAGVARTRERHWSSREMGQL